MQETPHDKILGDRAEQFVETLQRMYPDEIYTTRIIWYWAEEHAPELASTESKEAGEIKRLMEDNSDLKVFDKAVVAWFKTILKIYASHDAWKKENEAKAEAETEAPATRVKQYEQARLI